VSGESLHDIFQQQNHASVDASAVYAALKATGRLRDQRIISYHCTTRHCLLLDVIQIPDQVVIHQPPYRLSPAVNTSTSNASGRAANTIDGERRWKAQTYDPSSAVNFTLTCDHLHQVVVDKADVQADIDAGHAAMIVGPGGERRAR